MKLLVAVLSLVCILDVAPVVFGCRCILAHTQQKFCQSQFVVSVVPIQEEKISPTQKSYKLLVLEIFKDNYSIINSWSVITVITSSSGASCGVQLGLFKQNIIGGHRTNNQLRINLCGLHGSWSSYSRCEISLMRGFNSYGYKRRGYDCSCKVTYCFRDTKCNSTSSECLWNSQNDGTQIRNCQKNYRGVNSCQWTAKCY